MQPAAKKFRLRILIQESRLHGWSAKKDISNQQNGDNWDAEQ